MKKCYKILLEYFREKYNILPGQALQYVADELIVTPVYLGKVMTGRIKDKQLDKLAEETVKTLLPDE